MFGNNVGFLIILSQDDIDKRNETNDEPIQRSNITCTLSAKVNVQNNSSKCPVTAVIDVVFYFNNDNKISNITFSRRSPGGRKEELIVGLVDKIKDLLAEQVLLSVADYSTGNTTVVATPEANWVNICRLAPWGCY